MNVLQTETAEGNFLNQGAKICVLIPDDKVKIISISDILTASNGLAVITDPDEAGDDQILVRFGNGPQEALEIDLLSHRLSR